MSAPLRDVLATTRRTLSEFLPDHEAEREARLLLCHGLGISSAQLMARLDDPLPQGEAQAQFQAALEARLLRQPLAQIFGEWEFFGRPFTVSPDVLTPRADTEVLIDLALAEPFSRVLDLGTGSGAIAVTLLAERGTSTGIATDISQASLAVARQNATRLGVEGRLEFVQSDWFDAVTGEFDLIVSNPPYVTEAAYGALAPEITRWEPRGALTPGGDGLAAYRVLSAHAQRHLASNGRIMVEIGHDQGAAVTGLFKAAGLEEVTLHSDLGGRDRVVAARRP